VGRAPSKQRRQRSRTFRHSAVGPFLFAIGFGWTAALATALVLVVVAAALKKPAMSAWLAVVTPIASAMVGAAAAGSILHWRKVCGRGAVHVGVIGTALWVLLIAQFVRFIDIAALAQLDGLRALLRPAYWVAVWQLPVWAPPSLESPVPGLAAVSAMVGSDALWVFLTVEVALVLGLAWWMAGRALASPLCVACRAWCVRQRGVVERAADTAQPDVVRQRVAARDWRFFRDLGPARGGSSLRFDLARCPRCDRSNAVSVMWERPLWRDRCLIGDLRLGSDDIRTLLDLVDAHPKGHPA